MKRKRSPKQNEYSRKHYAKHRSAEIERRKAYNYTHREQNAASARERRKNPINQEKVRSARRLKKYGLTPEQYQELHQIQGGYCATCGRVMEGKQDQKECVDHCHADGHIRGLLCARCNLVLGKVKDNPCLLETLARYLRDHCPA